jgi:hypothetical protein
MRERTRMFDDFLIKHFKGPTEAGRYLMFVALVLAVAGVLCFRKRLALAISLALVFLLGTAIVTPSFMPARPYSCYSPPANGHPRANIRCWMFPPSHV